MGPLKPNSSKALSSIDKISKILLETPRSEWDFVLGQSKEIAKVKFDHKNQLRQMVKRLRKFFDKK